MKAQFTDFTTRDNWVRGTCEKYQFEAKLFDIGSVFGIKEGRVSKLAISHPDYPSLVIHYDRGWDIKVKPIHRKAFNAIMELCENSPKRFEP